MASSLPAYVKKVPTYRVIDGQMHIKLGGDLSLVMPISVFQQGCALGLTAIREWHHQHRSAEIIPMRDRAAH
jgi:uncharacterized membrane protein